MTDLTHSLRERIRDFQFGPMFINELGWDNFQDELAVPIDGATYRLRGVAHKRGLVVYLLETAEMPDGPLRNKIETQVARSRREHILIFADEAHTRQVWLWALREIGRPLARRSFDYHAGQSGEALAQRLDALAFSLAEEDDLTLVEVAGRVRAAFNVERATKKFYDGFSKERDAFGEFIGGIPDADMSKWYVSVMLNRLMFIYFIQKKGFLDGDTDYLRNRLAAMRATYGEDRFDRFYRYFLLRLFHDGLGKPNHDPDLQAIIGRVPYLNGGIFQIHEVEKRYPDIRIPDKAFERVFDFFDRYQWHLDDRPLRDDREINPDVLGYIFEKYINQKQMGAYYTKEDITEYISKNTIIPFLFDRARRDCAVAFQGETAVWSLTAADPDRYIYDAVRKGTDRQLPDEIAAGIDDVGARTLWNTPTPDEYALPTEIWRETVARRRRHEETRAKLAGGEVGDGVADINDFITLNLDIRQFAQDVIEQAEGADLLAAFWGALSGVSVLDPTCGSGAFLFAALNVLEPLYEAAIARMREFTAGEDWRRLHPRYAERFGAVLADIGRHPNETYFIQKSIIVNNLYGVDIMEEAVEIAKLRLFLKLASQLERVDQVEPLPDIDFNIRAGNTLVGYVKREEVRDALANQQVGEGVRQGRMVFGEDESELAAVEEQAADIDRLYNRFRDMQTGDGLAPADDLAATKAEMRRRLAALNDTLDRALARQYGVDPDKGQAFDRWRSSHQPFHWFTEFYGILKGGGFDVVVGNPPYVEYKDIQGKYQITGYQTSSCQNLFAYVVERCIRLGGGGTRNGLIVPVSAVSTDRMIPLIKLLKESSDALHIANFSWRPGKLFEGVNLQLTILLQQIGSGHAKVKSSKYTLWESAAREWLFFNLGFSDAQDNILAGSIPKLGSLLATDIFAKLRSQQGAIEEHLSGKGENRVFYRRGGLYWKVFVDFETGSSEEKIIHLKPEVDLYVLIAVLSSSLWFWYLMVTSDCRHLGNRDINSFPFQIAQLRPQICYKLHELGKDYVASLVRNAEQRVRVYKGKKAVDVLSFQVKKSKSIIDEIDRLLAQHYRFTDEELDYIINYDIKYRMGEELN